MILTKASKRLTIAFSAFLLIANITAHAQECTTNLKITGIRSTKGKIMIAVFKDNEGFDKMTPFKRFFFDKKQLAGGNMSVAIKLTPGTYGLSLLDDEDSNGKMEKNFIGLPKEGFGFSDFYLSGLKRPKYDDFKVELTKDQGTTNIKLRYM